MSDREINHPTRKASMDEQYEVWLNLEPSASMVVQEREMGKDRERSN